MNDSRIAPVFQIMAEDIHALGVRTVFGLMSDDTLDDLRALGPVLGKPDGPILLDCKVNVHRRALHGRVRRIRNATARLIKRAGHCG